MDQNDDSKLLHRDDIDQDTMAEIEAAFAEQFPGYKVVCVGDEPNVPPEVRESIEALNKHHRESLINGLCVDCGVQMDNWSHFSDDDWMPPPGWAWFTGPDNMPQAWQCPACDAKDKDGLT